MTTTAVGTAAVARTPVVRIALLALGGASLLAGLNAALVALDVWAPVRANHLADAHGQIMVMGFLGTLIALERAQALRRTWAYLAPALLGAGGIALAAGATALGELLQLEGAVMFLVVYLFLHRRAPLPLVAVQALSVVLLLAAALLVPSTAPATVLPLLVGFIVLAIAAERAELAQLALGRRAIPALTAVTCPVALGAAYALVAPQIGARITGAGLVAVAVWLARDDVARRQVRLTGFPRYNGAALLLGYGWLTVGGLVWLVGGVPASDRAYDVVVHTVFLGFALSMVMAHASTILPAVVGRPLPYRPVAWIPLALLHGGLLVRVLGDAGGNMTLVRAGSIGTVAALLVFVAVSAMLAAGGGR